MEKEGDGERLGLRSELNSCGLPVAEWVFDVALHRSVTSLAGLVRKAEF